MPGKRLLVASEILIVLSLLLQVIGYVTPGWEHLQLLVTLRGLVFEFVNRRYSLWYTCTREGCMSGRKDVDGMLNNWFDYFRYSTGVLLVNHLRW